MAERGNDYAQQHETASGDYLINLKFDSGNIKINSGRTNSNFATS